MRVRLRYWNKIRNCGDAISSYIVQGVLNATPVQVTTRQPHLLSVGSILFMARKNSYVWGSGMLRPYPTLKDVRSANIRAVRGKLTLAHLQSLRPDVGELPLGDPGIFVREVLEKYAPKPGPSRYRAAIVPHFQSAKMPIFGEYAQDPDVVIVDMRDDSLAPVRAMRDSDVVIAQSLHGLVFATALNKPCVWISSSADDLWCFKYRDWFTTTDNPQTNPLPLETGLETLIKACEFRASRIDRAALIDAFPWDGVGYEDESPLLDFESVRALAPPLLRLNWGSDRPVRRKWYLEDGTRAASLLTQIAVATRQVASQWAETPYLCFASDGFQIDRKTLLLLATFMDRHTDAGALVVLPSDAIPLWEKPKRDTRLWIEGMSISKAAPWLGGALFVRPTVQFSFDTVTWTVLLEKPAGR